MGVKLILVRHGQTDWNKQDKIQGATDIPLNNTGKKQIQNTARRLKKLFRKIGEKPDAIISSTLIRAKQSAMIIAEEFKMSFTVNGKIVEKNMGALEGDSWQKLCNKIDGNLKEKNKYHIYDYSPYGGESCIDVGERLLDFIHFVKKKYDGKTIIVVAHGGVIRTLLFWHPESRIDYRKKVESGAFFVLNI